ncbi:unnamed protein product [Allacma fusca]|uniref:Uncharacterized protein n=1 Tax=Allacma fusca TaxID=39272 RepID=A0A8J2NUH9_9HEXA|nr:unnamed protein product [Allacma fusca]
MFMFSLFPEVVQKQLVCQLIWCGFEYYFAICAIFPQVLAFNVIGVYVLTSLYWLRRFRTFTTLAQVRPFLVESRLAQQARPYLRLQLATELFNNTFSGIVVAPLIGLLVLGHVFVIYAAVRLNGIVPIPVSVMFFFWAIAFVVIEMTFFLKVGLVHEISKRMLSSWLNSVARTRRQNLMYLRPIGIKMGDFIEQTTAFLIYKNTHVTWQTSGNPSHLSFDIEGSGTVLGQRRSQSYKMHGGGLMVGAYPEIGPAPRMGSD